MNHLEIFTPINETLLSFAHLPLQGEATPASSRSRSQDALITLKQSPNRAKFERHNQPNPAQLGGFAPDFSKSPGELHL